MNQSIQLNSRLFNLSSYSPKSDQANTMTAEIGPICIWWSYQTVVAVSIPGVGRIVRQNDWGTTTGKHLNCIDGGDKKSRVTGEEFERILGAITLTLTNEPIYGPELPPDYKES